jgi:hypothetical protein
VALKVGNRNILWNARLLWLCVAFVCWSVVGLLVEGFPLSWTNGTFVTVYPIIHVGLVVGILRETGFRLWPIALCLIGLVAGEWIIFPGFMIYWSLALFGL